MITLCLDNHRQSFFGSWSIARFSVSWLSWAQESIRTCCSWSVSQILWWYTICCNAPTLNSPRNLDPDCVLYFEWKFSKTHASLSNSMQLRGHWQFMQIRQRICNCTDMQIVHFILDKILKLWRIIHAFLSLLDPKLSDLKNSPVFWPTLYTESRFIWW